MKLLLALSCSLFAALASPGQSPEASSLGEVLPVPVYGPPVLAAPPSEPWAPRPRQAIVSVTVSPSGKVTKTEMTYASDKAYGEAASETAPAWVFQPGTRQGKPDTFQMVITFDSTATDQSNSTTSLYRYLPEKIHESNEVDSEAHILWEGRDPESWPAYPREFRNSYKSASLTLRLVVDPFGFPVNPRLLNFSHPEFIGHAIAEIQNLHFQPALKGGAPVYSYFKLTMEFREEMPAASRQPIIRNYPRLPTPDMDAESRRIYSWP